MEIKINGRRKRGKTTRSSNRARAQPYESVEQIAFVARVRMFYPNVIIAAIPNGGFRRRTEAVRLKTEGVLAGMPDLLIPMPAGAHHGLFIEMKRADRTKASVSSDQKAVIKRLRDNGYKVVIAYGREEAWAEFEAYVKNYGGDLQSTHPLLQ